MPHKDWNSQLNLSQKLLKALELKTQTLLSQSLAMINLINLRYGRSFTKSPRTCLLFCKQINRYVAISGGLFLNKTIYHG